MEQVSPRRTSRAAKVRNDTVGNSINWTRVEQMLEAHVPGSAIAGRLGITSEFLYKAVKERFGMVWTDYAERFTGAGKAEILLAQYEEGVKKRNIQMLIHLGKHHCAQREEAPPVAAINITVKRKPPEEIAQAEGRVIELNGGLIGKADL
jgi:hypothetical protein